MAPPASIARRPLLLAALALGLAAINLTVRLDREMVDVWDESLYATSALELRSHGRWAVTTFQGAVDYFNSKPPLNVWLIATAFDLFGVGLVPLRLASVLAAWCTVLAVFVWTRRAFGAAVAALAALVLGTTYPFLYVHAGRTANADAPLALAVTLVFVTLWSSDRRPARAFWTGPLAAAVLLLKGPGVLAYILPLVAADAVAQHRSGGLNRAWLWPRALGAVLGAGVVAAWAIARWRFDGWLFLGKLFSYDIVGRATSGVEGHVEPWYYYGQVLLRHHYDWLTVGVVAVLLAPSALTRGGHWLASGAIPLRHRLLAVAWVVGTLVVPTLVPTRLARYLNSFYPGAAVMVALAVHHAWHTLDQRGLRGRTLALTSLVAVAVAVAEGRLVYRSVEKLDIDRSAQGLLLAFGPDLAGARVFAPECPYPEAFLAAAARASCVPAPDLETFLRVSAPGDLWLDRADAVAPTLQRLGANEGASLHRRP